MLARALKSNTAAMTLRRISAAQVRVADSRRHGHAGGEVAHGHDHHHDHHQVVYERLWRNKATLDWLPKPEGSWQEANAKSQAKHNQTMALGFVAVTLAFIYFKAIIVNQSNALNTPPYHLIGKEDFPGSKYEDATGTK